METLVNIRTSTAQDVALGVVLSHTQAMLGTQSLDVIEQSLLETEHLSPFHSLPVSSRLYRDYDIPNYSLRKLWKVMEWGLAFIQHQRKVLQTSKSKKLYIRYNSSPWYRPKRRANPVPRNPAELGEPGWLISGYPFLGFAPVSLRTPGFQHLLGPDPSLYPQVVVEEVAHKSFRMRGSIAQVWLSLEEDLSWFETALTSITPKESWAYSREYPRPSSFGYLGASGTHEKQLEAVVASWGAFRAQIASIRALTSINWKTWRDRVIQDFGVPQTWLDALHECGVVCPKPSRPEEDKLERRPTDAFPDCVGAFARLDNVETYSLLKSSIQHGMPVWIEWGQADVLRHLSKDPLQWKIWEEFHPRPSETAFLALEEGVSDGPSSDAALLQIPKPTEPVQKPFEHVQKPAELACDVFDPLLFDTGDFCDLYETNTPLSAFPNPLNPSTPPLTHPTQIPQPYPDSGQLSGETPHEFVARRKEMLERRSQVEKMEEQQSRLARIEHAKKKVPPGRKGAAVFEWLDVGNGQLLRQRVPKVAVEGTWRNYSEDAKVYDALKDEWDLWEGFDANGGLPQHLIEQYYAGLGEDGKPISGEEMQETIGFVEARVDPSVIREVREAKEFFKRNAERMQQTAISTLPDSKEEPASLRCDEDLIESVRLRFGFVKTPEGERFADDVGVKDFDKCLFKLYWTKPDATVLSNSLRHDLMSLVSGIESSGGCVRNLPCGLFDLHSDSPESLTKNANVFIQAEPRIVVTRSELDGQEPASKRAKQLRKTYFVSPCGAHKAKPGWTLMLSDPVSVLTCMRIKSNGFYDIVESLLRCGVPLHTVQPDQQAQRRSSKHRSTYLPVRLPSSTIRSADYLQYERRMKQLVLNNHRVGRAALMRGGIIWRLVIELVKIEDVLSGPSQERLSAVARVLGKDRTCTEVWYDDELTGEEEDAICGVFRSADEPTHESEQLWSFWPTPNVWETSSVNAGRWMPHNEEWFLKRRDFLKGTTPSNRDNSEPSGRLYYQKEWRMKLQGQKKLGLRVVKANKELSEDFLDSVFIMA